jgi:hypothetical protein
MYVVDRADFAGKIAIVNKKDVRLNKKVPFYCDFKDFL